MGSKFYKVAGITIEVRSDLPILETTFHPKFRQFETNGPGKDNVIVQHHFDCLEKFKTPLWKEIYNKVPWIIYKNKKEWVYQIFFEKNEIKKIHSTAIFNEDYTRADIYNGKNSKKTYMEGRVESLTLFPNDQLLLAQILAKREGCIFHSNGVVLNNKGFLFLGHSGHGKSTIAKIVKNCGGKILCDDRMIVRQDSRQIMIYGNWCYGKENEFSADAVPLNAIFFIFKSVNNALIRAHDNKQNTYQLLSCIIKPLITEDWWENSFNLIEAIVQKIPCYNLMFDKSGKIVDLLIKL